MTPDISKPVFNYFQKDKPDWVKLGKYLNWLFANHVDHAPGISGTFALKIHTGVKSSLISADFWASPIGSGFCESVVGNKESEVWVRAVKRMEELRKAAIQSKSKTKKSKGKKK